MVLSKFLSAWDRNVSISTMATFSTLIMAIALSWSAVENAKKRERVTLVPPHLNGKAEVGWNTANAEYYKAWGMYVATLIGNITPDNVNFVVDSLSDLFAAKIYPSIRAKILSLSKDKEFTDGASAAYFAPRQVVYEPSTRKVFVAGNYITTTATSVGEITDTQPVVMEMIFSMYMGGPRIDYFDNYRDVKPHTLKWLRTNPPKDSDGDEE